MNPPFREGDRVTVVGVLRAKGPRCSSFEDDRDDIAITTVRGPGGDAVTARAERLFLEVDGREVEIPGAVRVLTGSQETRPGATFADLAAGVARRVAEASGDRPLPAGKVRFASLRAGDRVRATGVITRGSPKGGAIAYRDEAAPWSLTPDTSDDSGDTAAVTLSFEGSPRVRGPVGAMLRGVRSARRPVIAALGLAALAGTAVGLSRLEWHPTTIAPPPVKAPARRLNHKECEALAAPYLEERDRESLCTRDDECTVDLRGEQWTELDGCFRFRNRSVSTAPADALAERWLAGGCARGFDLCSTVPATLCKNGRCAERPPPPIPEDWARQDAHHMFSMFLPPGFQFAYPPHDDVLIYIVFGGQGVRGQIMYEPTWQRYDDVSDERLPRYQPITLHGVEGVIRRASPGPEEPGGRALIDLYLPVLPPCPADYCISIENYFRMSIACDDKALCDKMMLAVNSLEFY